MSDTKMELAMLVESSGLEVTKQKEIAATLGSFFEYAANWTDTVNSLVITDVSEVGKMQMAKAGRLDLKNKRLEASKLVEAKRNTVKAAMSEFTLEDKLWLKAGQMMELQFKHLEGLLEEKEKFAERHEAQRIEALKNERFSQLAPLGFNDTTNLGTMSDDMFNALKAGLIAKIEAEKEAERKAEAERIAKEKADREERERIEAENARLKAEAEAKEREIAAERARVEKERREAEEKARAEREAIEAAAREFQRIADEKAAKERADAEVRLKAERDAREKLEREARAKELAEKQERERIEAQRIADEKAAKLAAEKAAKAPKKEKLTKWIDGLELSAPAEFADDLIVGGILQKFEAFKAWAKGQIETL